MIPWHDAVRDAVQSVEPSAAWPTPITERLPGKLDADRNDQVQVLTTEGWQLCHWVDVGPGSLGWQHTPIWRLQREANETALDQLNQLVLAVGRQRRITPDIQRMVGGIRQALEERL